jgi:hypothetical protein
MRSSLDASGVISFDDEGGVMVFFFSSGATTSIVLSGVSTVFSEEVSIGCSLSHTCIISASPVIDWERSWVSDV